MEEKICRLGMIGTGRIAERFVNAALQMDGVEVVCVYNPNIDSAKRFSDMHYVGRYTECLDELIELTDAIYIASPHETHYGYAKELLQNGSNSFIVEKTVIVYRKQKFKKEALI